MELDPIVAVDLERAADGKVFTKSVKHARRIFRSAQARQFWKLPKGSPVKWENNDFRHKKRSSRSNKGKSKRNSTRKSEVS
jgi:hypothetical protein